MGCIQPDGTLTSCGEQLLLATWHAGTAEQVAESCHAPLFRVRSAIREFVKAGLVEERDSTYMITPKGIEKMEE
jgi:predicted transcriptional regulator